MPMLTPMPPSLGAGVAVSPKGEPDTPNPAGSAQGAGGQSREGNTTETTQNTWTRLFQSLLSQNQKTDKTTPAGKLAARKAGGRDDTRHQPPDPSAPLTPPVIAIPVLQTPTASLPVVQPIATSTDDPAPATSATAALPVAGTTSMVSALPTAASAKADDFPAMAAKGQNAPAAGQNSAFALPDTAKENSAFSAGQAVAAPQNATPAAHEAASIFETVAQETLPPVSPPPQGANAPMAKNDTPALAGVQQNMGGDNAPPSDFLATPSAYSQVSGTANTTTRPAPTAQAAVAQASAEPSQPITPNLTSADMVSANTAAVDTVAASTAFQNTNSQIAQDERTPGPEIPSFQAPRQGGRAPFAGANTAGSETSRTAPSTAKPDSPLTPPSDAAQTGGRSSSAGQDTHSDTGGNGKQQAGTAQSANTGHAADTAAPATPAPTFAASAANAQLVQGSTQAERIDVIRQIASQVSASSPSNGANSLTVQIHPAHWGELKVSVTTIPAQADTAANDPKSIVAATIITSDPSVRDALKEHMQDLSRALTSAGFRVDKVEIATQATTAATAGHGSGAFHSGQDNNGSGNSGYTPNPNSFSAQTGGDSRQGSPFSAAFGQQQGGQQGGGQPYSSQGNPAEPDSPPPAIAPAMLRRGRVDFRA